MNSAMVVKRHTVSHLIHGLPTGLEFPAVQAAHFQAAPEALRRGVMAKPQVSSVIALAAHGTPHFLAAQR